MNHAAYLKLVEQNPGKYPANMGKKWLDDEVVRLMKSVKAKKTHKDIAAEHERTLGGIVARLKTIAADYYFDDLMDIDDIQRFTGLDKNKISHAITKRELQNYTKAKAKTPKKASEPIMKSKTLKIPIKDSEPTVNVSVKAGEPTIAEVYELLKDIQKDFKIIVEKIETMVL